MSSFAVVRNLEILLFTPETPHTLNVGSNTEQYVNQSIVNVTIFNKSKIFLILLAISLMFSLDLKSIDYDYEKLLNLIITINGVLIAVIATFLYSKILVERAERIQMKIEIDTLSLKLSSLRRIATYLLDSTSFWKKTTSVIYENYPSIDIFTLREFNYDQFKEFHKKNNMGELNSQAFLALEKIKGADHKQLSINQNYKKNYNLQELSEYHKCCLFVYSYCSEHHSDISIAPFQQNRIKECLIDLDSPPIELTSREVGELFSNFSTNEIERLYQLTIQNNQSIGNVFYWIFFDILASFMCLSIAIFGLVYLNITNLFISTLVLGTIWIISDLILNTFYSLKNEIMIEQFYK